MTSSRLPLVLFCLGAFLFAGAAQAQDTEEPRRTVQVSGEGTATASPNQATVRFGIVTRADDPEVARAQNAKSSSAALNAVRELGVPESDLRMETLRLAPRREYDRETRTYEEKGYEATRQVVVELDSLELLPRLVAQVVQRGANRLEGIEYGLSDRNTIRNEALRRAATSARDKARLLAETLGARLGDVREIHEQNFSFGQPSPRVQMEFARASQADAQPEPDAYAAGEIEVSAQVQVVFDLLQTN